MKRSLLFITLAILIVGYVQVMKLLNEILRNSRSPSSSSTKTISITSLLTSNNHSSLKTFNTLNPYKETWCPSAKCYNSPLCAPCHRRFLFILATGRSGSTSLLRMFNELPNVRLSGENYNVLFEASEVFKTIVEDQTHNFVDEVSMKQGLFMHDAVENGAFKHNAMPIGSFSCVMQNLLTALNPPNLEALINNDINSLPGENDIHGEETMILGMKEIRIQSEDLLAWTPEEATKFFNENFPCSRFIININSRYIRQSMAMKKHLHEKVSGLKRSEVRDKLKRENDFLIELSSLLGTDSAKLLDIAEWSEDVSVINDAVNWLGFENCRFDTLVEENKDGYNHDSATILDVGPDCKYPHK